MITRNDLQNETIEFLNVCIKKCDIFTFALRMLNNDFDPSELVDFLKKEFKTNKEFSKKVVSEALTCID
jgi:hypothetical protein